MTPAIAILGLSCEFPGAKSPDQLWDTALNQRRWFRNLPPERLSPDYIDLTGELPDLTRLRRAAILEGYRFPFEEFGVNEGELRTADFTHWLALDCATRALRDSGLDGLLPRESTGVFVGNSLTGESSRADLLRLRWPYVRRKMEESGYKTGKEEWLKHERHFKAPLAPFEGRTLAGALSNVIAGRIAQHHDLKGGCHCVDAACASSLMAIAQACSQLLSGEIECAVVGGVDVSLDPLELVGFSKAGAVCFGEMKVFDVNRQGFIPGEGCGFAVLMRADHPSVRRTTVRALIRGWGISSDGRHRLTAPSPEGQRLALERTYHRAGFSIDTVPFFEAHGTGTDIGDQVEISTLIKCLNGTQRASVVGSIKANIGHTKAAAGMAGMIKAISALEHRILPPTTGCDQPMDELRQTKSLRVASSPEEWPAGSACRAGVSGFGFGGVNVHLVLEGANRVIAQTTIPVARTKSKSGQLFAFCGNGTDDLIRQLRRVRGYASFLADDQLASLAQALAGNLQNGLWRAAVLSADAEELVRNIDQLTKRLNLGDTSFCGASCFAGKSESRTRTVSAEEPLQKIATDFVSGAPLPDIYEGQNLRHFDLASQPTFFVNPCESTPLALPDFALRPDRLTPYAALAAAIRELPGVGREEASNIELERSLSELGIDSLDIATLTAGLEKSGYRPNGLIKLNLTVNQIALSLSPSSHLLELPSLPRAQSSTIKAFDILWEPAPPSPLPAMPLPAFREISSNQIHETGPEVASAVLVRCTSEGHGPFFETLLKALQSLPAETPVVFLDSTGQLAGFAKSLALEEPARKVCLIHHTPAYLPNHSQIAAELAATGSFHEASYTANGGRCLPYSVSTLIESERDSGQFGPTDVIMVTGGGKGITAACAAKLARATGASLALIGRSPSSHREVQETLENLADSGAKHHYWQSDIADALLIPALLKEIERELGSVTAVLHGAGVNSPCPIRSLTVASIVEHCRAKVQGLRHLLEILPPSQLKAIVALGSIIARTGYDGSAAYALANDQLAGLLADYQRANPQVRCQTQDWTAWSELGMANNLNAVSKLQAQGVEMVATELGTEAFLHVLRQQPLQARVILAPALPPLPTLPQPIQPPVLKDWPSATIISYTPEVELTVEVQLSLNDLSWLAGHSIKKEQVLLPGMLALEIMESVVMALVPGQVFPTVEELVFSRPVSFPEHSDLRITIRASTRQDGSVTCLLSEDGNPLAISPAVSAILSRTPVALLPVPSVQEDLPPEDGRTLARQVYQHLLFHSDRFQSIDRYSYADARGTRFHLLAARPHDSVLQQRVINRDAFIHGIQVCVPGELLLPSRIDRIIRKRALSDARTVMAQEYEKSTNGTFGYHLAALNHQGDLVEQWQGLELKRYKLHAALDSLPIKLAGIHQQRHSYTIEPQYFEYRHTAGFKDTNVVGNVYFTNHLEWQGRCREFFLKAHAPELLNDLEAGTLALVTVRCDCDYKEDVRALNEIAVRMSLEELSPHRATMRFDYWRINPDAREDHIAIGHQTIAARTRTPAGLAPAELPPSLILALEPYLRRA